MGVYDTEFTHKIQNEQLIKLLNNIDFDDPKYSEIFKIHQGPRGLNESEWRKTIISYALIDPKCYDLQSKEGKKEIYLDRVKAAQNTGLIKKNQKLPRSTYQELKHASSKLREVVITSAQGMRVTNTSPGWSRSAQLKRQNTNTKRGE
ncbi:hypothetical protein ACFL0F_00675 [Patescibacteria group bacterium]